MPLARLPPFRRSRWRGLPSSRRGQGGPWSTPTQHPQLRVTFVRLPLRAPSHPCTHPVGSYGLVPAFYVLHQRRKTGGGSTNEKKRERERRQLTRRCAGMGNAKYTSVPSRSLRSLPRSLPFRHPSLSLHPPLRRFCDRSMCLASSLSRSRSRSVTSPPPRYRTPPRSRGVPAR